MLDPNIAAEEGQVYIYAYNLAMLIVWINTTVLSLIKNRIASCAKVTGL